MTTSLLTKLSIAVAATMITLSPALADRPGKHRSHGHAERYGHSSQFNYKKNHYHGRHFHGRPHWYHTHRHWRPRYYGWRFAYRPYRNYRGW